MLPTDLSPQTQSFPFTVEGLLSWLKSEPPETEYNFCSSWDCLLSRFGKLTAPYYSYNGVLEALFKTQARRAEHCFRAPPKTKETYGLALQQLEHFLSTGEPPL